MKLCLKYSRFFFFRTRCRVGEPTAAWQFADIRQHRLFDNGWQYVSCGQWQPPLSDAPVNKWLSTITRERRIPPDSESGGIPHLFRTIFPHIGNAWRARHDNNKQQVGNGGLLTFLPCDALRCTVLVIVILSVSLSVRPSVCHSWTVSTWFDLRSWFFHHMVAPSF